MNTANTPQQLLNQFKGDIDLSNQIQFEHMDLSPPLVLAAALLYMMASDGEINDAESSQLQSVLGGNEELLACAASYVQSVPLDTFLFEAAQTLSTLDKLCILTNVCDSFLSDGQADEEEIALFSRMCKALGFDEAVFEPHLKTIRLKNDKSALGDYSLDGAVDPQGHISNHLALAACLVYMMASDGSIGTEEIGRLKAAIGEFEGLQSVALKYVLKVKNDQFLQEVAPRLSAEVKLLILTNVCDTLLSDGVVEQAEKKLFARMLTGFGYSEKSFRSYYETLQVKNIKSFDLDDFSDSAAAKVFRSAKYQASQAAFIQARAGSGEDMGEVIHRTMEDNIASVSQNAGSLDNIHAMRKNANHLQNIQKISAGQREENIQFVPGSGLLSENIQFVDAPESLGLNIQNPHAAFDQDVSRDRMQLGQGGTHEGFAASESTSGIELAGTSAADAGMSAQESQGKGGLTTMARGEVSFRDRAMQNGQALTQFTRTQAPMDAATLRLRLQALKQRNAELDIQLQKLSAGPQSLASVSASVSSQTDPVPSAAGVIPASALSVVQRMRQKVNQYMDRDFANPTGMGTA